MIQVAQALQNQQGLQPPMSLPFIINGLSNLRPNVLREVNFCSFFCYISFCHRVLAWMTPTILARFLKPCFVADEKILSLFPFLLAIWKSPFSQRPHSSELFQLLTSTSHRLEPQPVAVADGTSPSRNTSRGDFRDLWHTWWAKWEKWPVLQQLEVR